MPNFINSANMNLPIPVIGTDPGPDWASNLNNSLTIVDQHDHSAGSGVQINPAGILINSDLTFNDNNLTNSRSIRFQSQSAVLSDPTDIGCLYEVDLDLYYNDGAGNQIRITQSGGVAGTPGSIANLTPPASASYVSLSSTFVWQSNTNTPANLDAASILLRNLTANSRALTLDPPAAMGADYTITLPSLPGVQNIMTLDASGNMSAPWNVDNSTIEVSSNTIQVKAGGITSSQIAPNTITNANMAPNTLTGASMAFNIDFPGSQLFSDSQRVVVARGGGGSQNFSVLAGTVDNTGGISVGTGFTISHPTTGQWTITFGSAYGAAPVLVPQLFAPGGTPTAGFISILNASGSSVNINTFNAAAVPTDIGFSFICFGVR